MLETLQRNGLLADVLRQGAAFPDFVVPSAEGKLVALRDLLQRGPVVISFFRGDWCPFCRLMLAALSESLPEIEAAGASLLALTPEVGGLALRMKTRHQARFEVLADIDCGVGLAAGVVFKVPPLYRARLEAGGNDVSLRQGNSAWFLPIPATFILDPQGIIAWRFADVDFTHRAEPADILRALHQLGRG